MTPNLVTKVSIKNLSCELLAQATVLKSQCLINERMAHLLQFIAHKSVQYFLRYIPLKSGPYRLKIV